MHPSVCFNTAPYHGHFLGQDTDGGNCVRWLHHSRQNIFVAAFLLQQQMVYAALLRMPYLHIVRLVRPQQDGTSAHGLQTDSKPLKARENGGKQR